MSGKNEKNQEVISKIMNPAPPVETGPVRTEPQGNKLTLENVIGTVSLLMTQSPAHRHMFMADLEWLVIPPVMLRQFRIFKNNNNQPVGFVTWASLNEEVSARLKSGVIKLAPGEWKSGDKVYIIDVISSAPIHKQIVKELYEREFKGKEVNVLRPKKGAPGLENRLLTDIFAEEAQLKKDGADAKK